MALNTTKLKSDLLSLFKEMRTKTENSDEEYAEKFSNIIESYVKTGTVVVAQGIATQVSPGSGTGATIATGTGIIE